VGERPAGARARDEVAARPGAVGGLERFEGLRIALAPGLGVPDQKPRRSPHVGFLAVGRRAGEGEGLAEAPSLERRLRSLERLAPLALGNLQPRRGDQLVGRVRGGEGAEIRHAGPGVAEGEASDAEEIPRVSGVRLAGVRLEKQRQQRHGLPVPLELDEGSREQVGDRGGVRVVGPGLEQLPKPGDGPVGMIVLDFEPREPVDGVRRQGRGGVGAHDCVPGRPRLLVPPEPRQRLRLPKFRLLGAARHRSKLLGAPEGLERGSQIALGQAGLPEEQPGVRDPRIVGVTRDEVLEGLTRRGVEFVGKRAAPHLPEPVGVPERERARRGRENHGPHRHESQTRGGPPGGGGVRKTPSPSGRPGHRVPRPEPGVRPDSVRPPGDRPRRPHWPFGRRGRPTDSPARCGSSRLRGTCTRGPRGSGPGASCRPSRRPGAFRTTACCSC